MHGFSSILETWIFPANVNRQKNSIPACRSLSPYNREPWTCVTRWLDNGQQFLPKATKCTKLQDCYDTIASFKILKLCKTTKPPCRQQQQPRQDIIVPFTAQNKSLWVLTYIWPWKWPSSIGENKMGGENRLARTSNILLTISYYVD